MKIIIIHGPNLNFTGIRQTDVYGSVSLADINSKLTELSKQLNIDIEIFQSNYEGAIIDKLQQCYYDKFDGIIINPGALTHYSYALQDAIKSVSIPAIEVHMSNIYQREAHRHQSVISSVCMGQISGFGHESYYTALELMKRILETKEDI